MHRLRIGIVIVMGIIGRLQLENVPGLLPKPRSDGTTHDYLCPANRWNIVFAKEWCSSANLFVAVLKPERDTQVLDISTRRLIIQRSEERTCLAVLICLPY